MTRAALNVPKLVITGTEVNREHATAASLEEVSVSCHEKEIPSSVEEEMESLYENFFSSLGKFRALGEMQDAYAYVRRKGNKVTSAFLFRKEGKRVHVLNEFIRIEAEELEQLAHYLFSRYKDISVVSFRAIQPVIETFPLPYQIHNCIEDIVLSLPGSVEEYQASLGKNMRKNIKTHLDRIKRSHPTFSYAIYEKDDIEEHHIRSIIQFNRERTIGKNKVPGVDKEEVQKTVDLVKACGMVAVVTIDGKICAGKLFFKVGANYFSLLNAHSPEFNEYRLGTLCNYLSICECIARGGKEYHFLWGREEFKYRFLGVQRDYDELIVYRSRLHMLMNIRSAMETACNGWTRQLRLWLLDPKRKENQALKIAKKTLRYVRSLKHHPQNTQEE